MSLETPALMLELDEFLSHFFVDPEEAIEIRAFVPKNAPKSPAKKLHLTRATLPAELPNLLALNESRGLYFVVNLGGSKAKDITRFNACFVENDTLPIAEQHARLDACPIQPNVRIETAKSVHAYWLLDGSCTADEWRAVQQRLIAYFGSDPSIKDPSRVMRLPGFDHIACDPATKRYTRTPVKVDHSDYSKRYTSNEFEAFDLAPMSDADKTLAAWTGTDARKLNQKFAVDAREIPFDRYKEIVVLREVLKSLSASRCDERSTWLAVICAVCNRFGGDDEEAFAIVDAWSKQSAKYTGTQSVKDIWDGAARRDPGDTKVNFGTIIQWAREDSPAFLEWHESTKQVARVEQSDDCLPWNDLGNARRMVKYYGENIRYDHKRKMFFWWNGAYWIDSECAIEQAAKDVVRYQMPKEAASIADDELRTKVLKLAAKFQSTGAVKAMIEMLKSEAEVQVDASDFDTQPHLLNLDNGVMDLQTGILHPPRREDLLTRKIGIAYDPAAICPLFEKTLLEIFDGSIELVQFFWSILGYILTGEWREQCAFIFYGLGANGKSLILSIIAALLGPYGTSLRTEALMQHKYSGASGHNEDVANLQGMRFAVVAELNAGNKLNESLFKQLTGGDRITASRKYGRSITFTSVFKLVIVTNHKPTIEQTDSGLWRRMRLVPFNVSFQGREDRDLLNKLLIELPGILTKAVRASVAYYKNGLSVPTEVSQATEAYREEQDLFAGFLDDKCEIGPFSVSSNHLYLAYESWCNVTGERRPMNTRAFNAEMMARKFLKERTKQGQFWRGIRGRFGSPSRAVEAA